MTPDEYCQQKAASSGSSFYYSFLFLAPARRRAITALYAYCREVDDVVDESKDENIARIKLGWWRNEIDQMFRGNPQHPVTQALSPCIAPYSLTQERLSEILDGMEMDLLQTRYLDFKGLERYCYLVAGVVGLCAADIFGRRRDETLEYARNLGMAFQLTNIIRDVGEDARRGRVYLPVNELQRFKVPVADILNARHSENFVCLMQFQYERAEHYYQAAFAALPVEDRRAQRAGLIMAAIYRALLVEIHRDGFQVLTQRVSLTPIRKLWLAWKTWTFG